MTSTAIYKDIVKRTGGDIYIGVVGPVRTGKSTFIRKFMENVIIPGIEDDFEREKARDELPQSAGGRTIMTAEPKFIPDKSVNVVLDNKIKLSARMVDCVGYLIPDALGNVENGDIRMVNTPWSDSPVPFEDAAEFGTRKVISEHATIGMLVTTDGTIGDIPRNNYVEAEERVATELKELGKPFAIILNSAYPDSKEAEDLAVSLEDKYGAPVALVNCLELNIDDINVILEMVLSEFPIKEISVKYPVWITDLEDDHPIKRHITDCVRSSSDGVKKLSEGTGVFVKKLTEKLNNDSANEGINIADIKADLGNGNVTLTLTLPDILYYNTVSEFTGLDIKSDKELLGAITALADIKKEYDRISEALEQVWDKGYGIVMPGMEDLKFDDPEVIKQAGGYGIKLRASADSIHMIKTKIDTEINPIIGTEEQSEEMVKFMLSEMNEDPERIWNINMFGRSMYDLISDGIKSKLEHMPEEARGKMSDALSRIISEGCSGLLCIIL